MIRSATPADIPSLITLERQCASAAHWTEDQYRQAFQPQGVERFVLVSECSDATGEIGGFLVALNLGSEWELENIVVAPAARRKRLGTRLLDALFAAAAEKNSDAVFLEVRESNAAARTLYEKAGLELSGRRKSYYANPAEDAVLYRRTIRRRA